MDFYKSLLNNRNGNNSNSTSSNNSNSSHHSPHAPPSVASSIKSNNSNGGAAYNLEYCTSSSSLSPFEVDIINSMASPANSCPSVSSSSARTVVHVGYGEVGNISSSDPDSSDEIFFNSPPNQSSSSQKTVKRKRSSSSSSTRDHELGFEPSAKRLHRVPSLYQSDSASSLVSSVYPTPVKDEDEKCVPSPASSDYLVTNPDYESAHDEIIPPDSPYCCDSLHTQRYDRQQLHARAHAHHLLRPTTLCTHAVAAHEVALEVVHEVFATASVDDDESGTDDCDEVGDEDEIVSASSSSPASIAAAPVATTYSKSRNAEYAAETLLKNTCAAAPQFQQHHGERTPGQRATSATLVYPQSSPAPPTVKSFDDYVNALDCMTPAAEPEPVRQCPLPALSWANAADVWQLMCKKDEQATCLRDPAMLESHPGLQPRMRAILLDWLIEVCEVYKLHRETYYLAVDYLDRYLSAQKKVQKTHLQLIGITCLFIAAKVEEIYPPKIGEFAYVTDGACQEAEILQHEILLLQALEWSISPVTPMGWLGVYMQLNVNNRTPASFTTTSAAKSAAAAVDDAFIYPQFSGMEFVQTAQLLDLCSLDVGIGHFPYSVIAAAAISHTFNRETALRCSGLDWQTIESCARWMEPFFHVVCEESQHLHLMEQNEQIVTKFGLGHVCPNIVTDDSHIIQTHTTTMTMFDRACLLQEQHHHTTVATKIKQEASPAMGLTCPEGLLTPPASSRKPQNGSGSQVGAATDDGEGDDYDDDNEVDPNVENRENIAAAVVVTYAARSTH